MMAIDESRVNELPESVRIALDILDYEAQYAIDALGDIDPCDMDVSDDMRYRVALANAIMQAYGALAANAKASIWK